MRFTAKTADIRKLFEGALPFSAKRNALSVTGCFKLDATDNRLTLTACDSAKAIETSIPIEVEIAGCAVADSSKLKDILKAAKEYDEIVFEMASDGKLEISNAGEQRFMMKLKTIPADRFPTLDKPKDVQWFSIAQDNLLTMADKTTFMVGKDPARIALTGCCIEKKADRLVMAATDGKRLARISRPASGLPDIGRPIVPTPFLDALKGVLDGDGQAELAVHNGRLYLKAGTIYAYTSLIKGSYPYYTRVIPEEFKLSARVETKDIRTAFDIILNATNTEVSHKARFELEEDKGMLSSVTEEYDGKASVKVAYKGEPFSFLVSDKLFSSMVAKVPDDTFTLSLISPTTAIGMTWDSDPDALYIIMPMAS